jgi:hypothetical protein
VERQEWWDKIGLLVFRRRNPGLNLRRAENLSYGGQMGFNRENVNDFIKLS